MLLHGLLLLLVVMILVVVLVGRVLVGMLLLMLLRGEMLLLLLHVRRPVQRIVMVMVHLLLLRRRRGHGRGRTRRRRGRGGELQVGEDAPASRAHPQGVPVDPSKPIFKKGKKVIENSLARKSFIFPSPGRQIRCVPLLAALVPDLPPEAPLHVGQRLHPSVARLQDLPQQRDVGDGQPQSVDLAQPLLVGEGGHVQAELLEGRVDAAGAEVGGGEGAVMLNVVLNFLEIIYVFLTS